MKTTIKAGVISDLKSLVDSLFGGLEKLFNVVTKDQDSSIDGDAMLERVLPSGKKVRCILYQDESNPDKVTLKISVTGKPDTVVKNIKADPKSVEKALYDTLEKKYGIKRVEVSESDRTIIGLKKVEGKHQTDVILTSVYSSYSANMLNDIIDSVVQSDELVDALSDSEQLFEITDTDDSYDMNLLNESEDLSEIEAVNMENRIYAAASIVICADYLYIMHTMKDNNSAIACGALDTLRSSARDLFDFICKHDNGDADTVLSKVMNATLGLMADDTVVIDSLINNVFDKAEFIEFFSVNLGEGFQYDAEQLCLRVIEAMHSFCDSVHEHGYE